MGSFVRVSIRMPHIADVWIGKCSYQLQYHPQRIAGRIASFGLEHWPVNVCFVDGDGKRLGYYGIYHPETRTVELNVKLLVVRTLHWRSNSKSVVGECTVGLIHELRHAWQHRRFGWLKYVDLAIGYVTSMSWYLIVGIVLCFPGVFVDLANFRRRDIWTIKIAQRQSSLVWDYIRPSEIDARLAVHRFHHEPAWAQALSFTAINTVD